MKVVGTTDHGEVVELNRRAVEADLLIYVSLNLVPMSGGHKSVAVGLCGYRSLRAHHNPHVDARLLVVHGSRERARWRRASTAWAALAEKALDVFHIETDGQ